MVTTCDFQSKPNINKYFVDTYYYNFYCFNTFYEISKIIYIDTKLIQLKPS